MLEWWMIFRASADLHYDLQESATLLFALKCAHTPGQRVLKESFYIDPPAETDHFNDTNGANRFTRVRPGAGQLHVRYQADVATRFNLTDPAFIADGPLRSIGPEVIPFLFPSRYCQSDRFRGHAFDLFGNHSSQYHIVGGISDWIASHISYRAGTTNEQSSAIDTFEQRSGVCRDFAHLGIALCRAMSIPARYVSCYSHLLYPNDFHAIFEAFIGGTWYAFDPTHRAPLNGIVRIATGRDAADASICSMFGNSVLTRIEVICNSIEPGFVPLMPSGGNAAGQAVSLL